MPEWGSGQTIPVSPGEFLREMAMSGTTQRTAAVLLLAIAVVLAGALLAAPAGAQDARDEGGGGGLDLGKGGPPVDNPPPGDGEADPDGHSINTEPWQFRDGAGDRFVFFVRWIREFLLFAILFGPLAGLGRSRF
jgi:hypothetical protein